MLQSNSSVIAQLGQVIPPDKPASGRGYRSLYSFRNLVEMRIGEELSRYGVPWKRISKHIVDLRNSRCHWLDNEGLDGWAILDDLWRWAAGTTVEGALSALKFPPKSFVAINVGNIKRAIRARERSPEAGRAIVQETGKFT